MTAKFKEICQFVSKIKSSDYHKINTFSDLFHFRFRCFSDKPCLSIFLRSNVESLMVISIITQ